MSNLVVYSDAAENLDGEIKLDLLDGLGQVTPQLLIAGYNRNTNASSPCLIMASNDIEALKLWLSEYQASPKTFRTYAKEVRRLLEFSKEVNGKPLSAWNRADFQQYEAFLKSPSPKSRWCGPSRPWAHPDWRPFRGNLAPRSVSHAMSVVSAAVDWLVSAGYLSTNPLKLSRLRTRKTRQLLQDGSGHKERVFTREVYDALQHAAENIDYGNRQAEKRKARLQFMFAFLFGMAPRISELARAQMKDFRQDVRGNWFWQTVGKGAKRAELPIPDEFVEILKNYRVSLGLSELPTAKDPFACIQKVSSLELSMDPIDASAVHRELKWAMTRCAAFIEQTNQPLADKVREITAHWFRHSAITEFYETSNDIRLTAEFARHESIQTTMLYSHVTDDKLRDLANKRGKKKEAVPPPSSVE